MVNELKEKPIRDTVIQILDTQTGEVNNYNTKTAACKAIKCDPGVIQAGRVKLYKQRYKITILSQSDN